jgi:MazG family protein
MKIDALLDLVKTLREKCPWDRRQTLASLKNNLVEETYEVVEAIEKDDPSAIKEELGDIIFLGFFLATILEDEKGVKFDDLISTTVKKYKNKHPHVFKDAKLPDEEAVLKFWMAGKTDIFQGIPKTLPALLAAKTIQERAQKLGFDWNSHQGPLEKINEEIQEVKSSINSKEVFEEVGDLLFACVNLARKLNVAPEDALRFANKKFIQRFRKVKSGLQARGKNIEDASLKEMDKMWDEIKRGTD